jgi:hypothetical protein
MLEIDVPDIPAESLSVVNVESPDTFQTLPESRVNAADLIAPVNVDEFESESAIELIESAITSPVNVSSLALNFTVPPFDPLVPHELAAALSSVVDEFTTDTPVRLIEAVVLETRKAGDEEFA